LLTNAGLNVGSVTETPTSNASLVGTVQSQGTASGSSVLRGTSINYVKYRAYITSTTNVTKTGTAYIWSPTWQSTYYGSGSRRTIDTDKLYFGRFSSTSTTGDQVSLIRVSDSALSTACSGVSGGRPYTITGVTFNYGVASGVGNSSKPLRFGYIPISSGSAPSTITYSSVTKSTQNAGTVTNGSYYSTNLNSTLISQCFTAPTYPLVINALDINASSYGALLSSSTYFTITLQWTETTTTYT
jgi:hypothetical protein